MEPGHTYGDRLSCVVEQERAGTEGGAHLFRQPDSPKTPCVSWLHPAQFCGTDDPSICPTISSSIQQDIDTLCLSWLSHTPLCGTDDLPPCVYMVWTDCAFCLDCLCILCGVSVFCDECVCCVQRVNFVSSVCVCVQQAHLCDMLDLCGVSVDFVWIVVVLCGVSLLCV